MLDSLFGCIVQDWCFSFCLFNKELEAIQKSEETKFGVDKMEVSSFTILVSSLSTLSLSSQSLSLLMSGFLFSF